MWPSTMTIAVPPRCLPKDCDAEKSKIVEKFLIHMIYKRQISCYIKRVERTKTLCINF